MPASGISYKFGGGRPARRVVAKTADYTVTRDDHGTLFTNRGDAGAITFTLPAAAGNEGLEVGFFVIADQDFTVAGTAGELVTFNDAAANSVAFSTDGEQLGAGATCVCDGTSWLVFLHTQETATVTVAT